MSGILNIINFVQDKDNYQRRPYASNLAPRILFQPMVLLFPRINGKFRKIGSTVLKLNR